MSEYELLTKLKGNSRTFAVHSSTPLAAVAAMGVTMGRSAQEGSYFRPSERVISLLDETNVETIDTDPTGVAADFYGDWVVFLRKAGLPGCGISYDEGRTPQENTVRFLNAHNRRIPAQQPRTVHESHELLIPANFQQDYELLLSVIRSGGDLKPYLSRDILRKRRPDRNDPLLNAWGIQHLHFRPDGTDHLLLCMIRDTDVFVIQVLSHNDPHLWVETGLLQIVHDNWPDQIAQGKLNSIPPENHGADKRKTLRGLNANFLTTVDDGTVYMAPGGGVMASGDSQEDRINCDKIFTELRHWQRVVMQSATRIRAALDWPLAQKIVVRMAFDNRDCRFYANTMAHGIIFDSEAPL